MRGLHRLGWAAVLAMGASCDGDPAIVTFEVEVATDYRPGVAFDEVRTRVSWAGAATPFEEVTVPVDATMDFRRGLQVLATEVTERDLVDVQVSLWLADELVANRELEADLGAEPRVRVAISCPADGICWASGADGGLPDAAVLEDMGGDGGLDGGDPRPLCPEASDPELRGCWHFEDDLLDGTSFANDLSGDASFGAGYNDRGLAVPEAVSIPHDESLAPGGLTITAWLRPAALPPPGSVAVVLAKSGDYQMRITDDGRLYCRVYLGDDTSSGWGTLADQVRVDEWVHVACTYDGNELLTWDNGVPQGNVIGTALAQGRTRGALTIGSDEGGADPFEGIIDDVYIWGYARSESEIRVAAGLAP